MENRLIYINTLTVLDPPLKNYHSQPSRSPKLFSYDTDQQIYEQEKY